MRKERVREGVKKADVEIPVEYGDEVLVHKITGVHSDDFPFRGKVTRVVSRYTHDGPKNLGCDVVVEVRIPEENATYIHGYDTEIFPLGGLQGKTWDECGLEVVE